MLCGPTPRDEQTPSWRPEALAILRELGFEGLVYVPEPSDGKWDGDDLDKWRDQVEWEEEALNRADVIVFWIPREFPKMLGLTTNDEWGFWKHSGKVVLGTSPGAMAVRYQRYYANKYRASTNTDLLETLKHAIERIQFFGGPILRSDGSATIPLHVYNTPEFRGWLEPCLSGYHPRLRPRRVGSWAPKTTWSVTGSRCPCITTRRVIPPTGATCDVGSVDVSTWRTRKIYSSAGGANRRDRATKACHFGAVR